MSSAYKLIDNIVGLTIEPLITLLIDSGLVVFLWEWGLQNLLSILDFKQKKYTGINDLLLTKNSSIIPCCEIRILWLILPVHMQK